jgi:nucleoside-diphosphate-sugar epimerase
LTGSLVIPLTNQKRKTMHTILGAGGTVANALTRELLNNNETIRLVSRKPVAITGKNLTWKKADLLNYAEQGLDRDLFNSRAGL